MLKIKGILVGESQTGKTCLLNKLVKDKFDDTISTNVAENLTKIFIINNKKISFELWDTAGQEKFRGLNKIFFKNAEIAFLVYDITKKETFDELQNFWLDHVLQFANPDVVLVIIGNKCDLFSMETVSEIDAKKYAKEKGAGFFLTSAKDGTGIPRAFEMALQMRIEKSVELKENIYGVKLGSQDNKTKKKECCGNK